MSIICTPDDVSPDNMAPTGTAPDEPYLVVDFAITPSQAKALIATLSSSDLVDLEARDVIAQAVLEAIKDSPYNPS